MSQSRHLVDPELQPMLEMPDVVLTSETLAEVRANPMFSGEGLPPPPFPITRGMGPGRRRPRRAAGGDRPAVGSAPTARRSCTSTAAGWWSAPPTMPG